MSPDAHEKPVVFFSPYTRGGVSFTWQTQTFLRWSALVLWTRPQTSILEKKQHKLTVGEFWQTTFANNLWGFFVESLDITKSPGSQIQEILPRKVTNVDPEKQWDWKTIRAFWNGPLFKGYSGKIKLPIWGGMKPYKCTKQKLKPSAWSLGWCPIMTGVLLQKMLKVSNPRTTSSLHQHSSLKVPWPGLDGLIIRGMWPPTVPLDMVKILLFTG